ncbi:MAG: metallophosphoesterase [Chitinophagaceae bacterium]|nr:metallophosphoesterase [Chitinophagaceae bacterium]
MRRLLRKIFGRFLTRLASKASSPKRADVFSSLSRLLRHIEKYSGKKGISIDVNLAKDKFIIFSDHHKGNKDHGDDFANNEPNYLAALDYYLLNKFTYINLGDAEELWKYEPKEVISKNITALRSEARFQQENKYFKTFGNHDVTWKNKLDVDIWFKDIFNLPLPIYEGILLKILIKEEQLSIFVTHGHQGDKMSDNNALSTWMVAHIWRPLQRYLRINVNTPAKDFILRDKHNIMMHQWSSRRKNLLLITGHTHKPVFASGLYSDHPNNTVNETKIAVAERKSTLKPSYFNSGCCCYNDGDVTGIEIADEKISLIKWHWDNNTSQRSVLEEKDLNELIKEL